MDYFGIEPYLFPDSVRRPMLKRSAFLPNPKMLTYFANLRYKRVCVAYHHGKNSYKFSHHQRNLFRFRNLPLKTIHRIVFDAPAPACLLDASASPESEKGMFKNSLNCKKDL